MPNEEDTNTDEQVKSRRRSGGPRSAAPGPISFNPINPHSPLGVKLNNTKEYSENGFVCRIVIGVGVILFSLWLCYEMAVVVPRKEAEAMHDAMCDLVGVYACIRPVEIEPPSFGTFIIPLVIALIGVYSILRTWRRKPSAS